MSHTTSWNPFYDFCYQTRPYCLLKTIRKGIKFTVFLSIWEPASLPPTYIQHSWTLVISNILNSDQFCSYFWYSNSKFFTTTSSLNDEMLVKIVFIPSRYCRSEMWKSSSIIGQSLQSSVPIEIWCSKFATMLQHFNLHPKYKRQTTFLFFA